MKKKILLSLIFILIMILGMSTTAFASVVNGAWKDDSSSGWTANWQKHTKSDGTGNGYHIDDGGRGTANDGKCDYCGCTLVKMTDCTITVTPTTFQYTGSDVTPTTITVKFGSNTVAQGGTTGYSYSYDSNRKGPGTCVMTFTGGGKVIHGTATVNLTISGGTASAPTLSDTSATYDGAAHAIGVSGGANGTVYYKTSTNNSSWGGWTTTKPTLTNVGTLYVKAYTKGDSSKGYKDSGETDSKKIVISARTPGLTLSNKSADYSGAAIAIGAATVTGVSSSDKSGGTVSYIYYTNSACTAKTQTSTGAASAGAAPKDAGTYYVKASITASGNYSATTSSAATLTINKKSVAVSWGSTTSFTYNGSGQAPTASATGVSGETLNITRTTQTNAGSNYTSTASLSSVTGGRGKADNYTLTGTTKTFSISKADPGFSVNKTSLTINNGSTGTATATYSGNGALSATSNDTNVATVAVSGKTITVTAKKGGSATITVSLAAGTNHSAGSNKTISVTVYAAPTTPTITVKKASAGTAVTSGSWSNENLTITIGGSTRDGTGNIQYQYRYKTTDSWSNYSSALSYTTATSSQKIYARAINASATSMTSGTAEFEMKIDKTAPVITSLSLSPAAGTWTTGSVQVKLNATDTGSGINGVATSPWGYDYCTSYTAVTATTSLSNYTVVTYPYNRTYVYVRIKDQAGNTAQSYIPVVNIDKTAPIFTNSTTHTDADYKNNMTKGTKLNSVNNFTSAPPSYQGGTTSASGGVLTVTHPSGNTRSGYYQESRTVFNYEVSKIYVRKIRANIKSGYTLNVTGNSVSGTITWLTARTGTGSYFDYYYIYKCNDSTANNMTYGHAYIEGSAASSAFTWTVSEDVTYDVTNIFDDVDVTYSGSNAILKIAAKDTQSGVSTIKVNNTNQTLTASGTTKSVNYTVSSATAAGTAYTIVATDGVSQSTTLTKTAYLISYNGNGSTGGSTANQIKINGHALTLNSNGFTRTNYKFAGWNTNAAGTGTNYAAGGSYTADAGTTLYAKWTAKTAPTITPNKTETVIAVGENEAITFTYNGDGTTFGATTSASSIANVSLNESTKTVTISGVSAGTATITISTSEGTDYASATKTISVKVVPNTYTIQFLGNGSTTGSTANESMTFGTGAALRANGYARTGYTFDGWKDGAGNTYTNGQTVTINRNLLQNSGAMTTLGSPSTAYAGGWRSASGGTGTRNVITVSDAPANGITKGISITGDGAASDVSQDKVPVVTGNTYTMSVWAKGTGTLYLQAGNSPYNGTRFTLSNVTEWTRYTWTFVAGQNNVGSTNEQTNIYFGNRGTGTMQICGMKLESGSNATMWVDSGSNMQLLAQWKDATDPTVVVSETKYPADASITLTDAQSGIRYFAVTTTTTAPTESGEEDVTKGDTLNFWYRVTNSTSATTVAFEKLNVGTYYAWGKDATGNTSYTAFEVIKGDPTNPTLTAYNEAYDGNPHSIGVSGGDGGTIQYSTDRTNWQEDPITITDVGSIRVYVRIYGDSNHNNSSAISETITITRAEGEASVSMADWVYGETASNPVPVSATNGTSNVTYLYKTKGAADSTYATTKPINPGEYTVQATFAQVHNYNAVTATADFAITIDPSVKTIDTREVIIEKEEATLTLDKNEVRVAKDESDIVVATYNGDGTISVVSNDTSIATATIDANGNITITGVAYGTTTVTVSVSGETNFTSVEPQTITVGVYDIPTKPVITAKDEDNNTVESGTWASSSVTITASGSTLGGSTTNVGYKYSLDGGTTWVDGNSVTVSTETDGQTIIIMAYDTTNPTSYNTSEFVLKLDKGNPTVSADNILYGEDAEIKLQDSLSGIQYFAVTTTETAPTNSGNSNVTTGSNLNFWYQVENSTALTTVTFTGLSSGTYYAWGKDAAGNTAHVPFTVTDPNYEVNGVGFTTLREAYDSIISTAPTTIKVLKSNTDSSEVIIASNRDVVIDLNGNTITKTTKGIVNNGTLTIKDGKTNGAMVIEERTASAYNFSLITTYGELTIDGAKVATTKVGQTAHPIWAGNGSTVNVYEGSVITATSTGEENSVARPITMRNNATINIYGGTITATSGNSSVGIESNASNDQGNAAGAINIYGGTITATSTDKNGRAVQLAGEGTATCSTVLSISNGTLSGDLDGILAGGNANGTITIIDGTIIGGTNGIENVANNTVVIGTKGGALGTEKPDIQGGTYGIDSATGFKFYDGILKGGTNAFNGILHDNKELDKVTDKETGCAITYGDQTIGGKKYETAYLVLDISGFTATLSESEVVYDGKEKEPTVTLKDDKGNTLVEGVDYEVEYKDNVETGEATVIIKGKGDYTGEITLHFTITPATPTLTLVNKTEVYTGSAISIGTVSITGVEGGSAPSTDATYEYFTNSICTIPTTVAGNGAATEGGAPTDAGNYYVKASIAASGNYTGATSNVAALTISAKEIAVVWGNITFSYDGESHAPTATTTGVTGETVTLSVAGATANIGDNEAVATIESVTGGREKAANYTLTNASITFTINTSSELSATAEGYTGMYDGQPHGITVNAPEGATVKFGEVNGTYNLDATPTLTNVGTKVVYYEVTKYGYEAVTGNATIKITPRKVGDGEGEFSATITLNNDEFEYDGTGHEPTPTVVVDGVTLKEGEDYEVTYRNNIDASETAPTVVISFIGNYTGKEEVTFTIKPKEVIVEWSNLTFDYDGAVHIPTAIARGIDGETITLTVTGASSRVGDFEAAATINRVTGGRANKNNYVLTNDNTTFTIKTADMTVTSEGYTGVYDGQPHGITVNAPEGATVKYGETRLAYDKGESPTLTNAGSKIIYYEVTQYGYNTVTGYETIRITPKKVGDGEDEYPAAIRLYDDEFEYTGQPHTPTPTVVVDGVTLEPGEDYDITYENNIDANDGAVVPTIIITFKGNYEGEESTTFTITPKKVSVEWSNLTFSYDEREHIPTASAAGVNGEEILLDLTGAASIVGSHEATATMNKVVGGRGNAKNYQLLNTTTTFVITNAEPKITLEDKTAPYTGSPVKIGEATVSGIRGGTPPTGEVTYKYYKDRLCEFPTTPENSGALAQGEAPVEAGRYYVIATIAADANYTTASSNIAVLTILGQPQVPTITAQKGTNTIASGEWSNGTLKISILSTQSNTGYKYSWDGIEWEYYTEPFTYSTETADKTIYAKSYNLLSETLESEVATFVLRLDMTNPEAGALDTNGQVTSRSTSIPMKAYGFSDSLSGIARYVWEYKSDIETQYTVGGTITTSAGEVTFDMPAEPYRKYTVRVTVYDNAGNSTVIDSTGIDLQLPEEIVQMIPTVRFTNTDNIVKDRSGKRIEAVVVFKSTTELVTIVIDGTEIDVSTLTPTKIGDEYTYEVPFTITQNGVYTASCTDKNGKTGKGEVSISAFNDLVVTYEVVEYDDYSEVVFTANVPVRILETRPARYAQDVHGDDGEYSIINRIKVTENNFNVTFKFEDRDENESEYIQVIISKASGGKGRFVRTVSKTSDMFVDFNSMDVNTAYMLAQDMENKVTTINSKLVSYYGVQSGQTDLFMARARDLGAATYLMRASSASSYDGKNVTELTGNPSRDIGTYGFKDIGAMQEYLAGYVGDAGTNNLTSAELKYKDAVSGAAAISLYKGFGISGISGAGFISRSGSNYNLVYDATTANSTFRVSIVNQ